MNDLYEELAYHFRKHDIQHYYGDHVRSLLIAVAVLSIVAIPFIGDLLPFGALWQVGAAVILVLVAGLINPHSKLIMLCGAIITGMGVLLLELTVASSYASDSLILLVTREAAALALLFAFYFSVKTLRAMMQGKVGQTERPWEFDDQKESAE